MHTTNRKTAFSGFALLALAVVLVFGATGCHPRNTRSSHNQPRYSHKAPPKKHTAPHTRPAPHADRQRPGHGRG